ncbi:response regulator [Pelagibacterium luteolum]|jgi:two-component system response regulator QseB|uniref:DNA-binding response regulator, OmpR family, contains REC and winged-helix (WHTH) domain n=1 Tax=Pelagibacterium luteolum TaxID=440168 RepID=A0A1G7Z447_9HYPH|nr:response regulator [Pelagibacterium luteolum]SDH03434.1 DNA-binding response regulator, OmpR family, contains REC and winged-helix (wHTH) domain [Pelagibacterium luteolum]
MRVLIVEDDAVLRDGLRVGLAIGGFNADAVESCEEAEAVLKNHEFDAMVLDLMLPDGSGLDVLKSLRERRDTTPVLLLTARDRVADRIQGLDAGADDYLGKPFDLDEVAARLRALVRRASGRPSSLLEWRGLRLDPATQQVELGGEPVRVSRREYAILHALMIHPGQILSRGQIEEKLYGWQEEVESNAVEVHIHHLRSKLGPGMIQTVRGIGYRLGEEP